MGTQTAKRIRQLLSKAAELMGGKVYGVGDSDYVGAFVVGLPEIINLLDLSEEAKEQDFIIKEIE